MTTSAPTAPGSPYWGKLAVAAGWVVYLPLGLQYLCLLACAALALNWTHQHGQWRMLARSPLLRWLLMLWLLLALSSLWSTAPPSDQLSHLWHYGRWLLLPVIAIACPSDAARRGLRHFAAASVLVALLTVLASWHLLPDSPLWSSTVASTGNQRIATSLLMAMGAAMALTLALGREQARRLRLIWLIAFVVTAVGLSLQDRRTGMLTLPVLLAVLALVRQRSWRHGLMMTTTLVMLIGLTWVSSDGVRARFAEGWQEMEAYRPTGEVATSWGMRARMVELSLDMVRDQPVLGHGIGAWQTQWLPRAQDGGAALLGQATPHNEYLLIAVQAGLLGLALWVGSIASGLRQAWRSGSAGHASLLVWTAIAWAGLFNVVARDAKFALPLLLLAALAMAAARPDAREP